ncbi:AAA-like domain-containing protein [Candidatus Parabeggiatoa sp. HSG14]|uniref:AAA-like domain-containing protein n=1 Tax=Candidatus Parabeggiatoa sp. HSG14 TaxID=3055593 RepID=UPI0025A9204B|nr:AAA-like domain-containing protein [Thiotrichales bacterium HSG14]
MLHNKRIFETRGPVNASHHYTVSRKTEITKLAERIKQGRYIVIFAPRQTGKTTFFRWTLDTLEAEDKSYFPIQLDFEEYKNISLSAFYGYFHQDICKEILSHFQKRQLSLSETLSQFLEKSSITDHISMRQFFEQLSLFLKNQKVVIIIDEFDGIPTTAVSDFLYSLRRIYLSNAQQQCPYSVGIVGVKNITQLNYDRSISPFNIQDNFALPNFTLSQAREFFEQYTEETGQIITEEVIENIHKQTAGQPFFVNRLAQILTEELKINVKETIILSHFEEAYKKILHERNVHISHLTTNIRRNRQFESVLMRIALKETPVSFNLDNDIISELFTYGVVLPDSDENCQIMNPIYQYRIMRTFQPIINGLEQKYFPEDTEAGFLDYLTSDGKINMCELLSNFRNFVARAGYRILQVPETPHEFVGQYLLFTYLDTFVRQVRGFMYLEVRTGRGRMDLVILHEHCKYIVETKLWEGNKLYQAGKTQLAKYLKLEGISEGYYVVFDHRLKPQSRQEDEIIEEQTIVSYTIPVIQEKPSDNK